MAEMNSQIKQLCMKPQLHSKYTMWKKKKCIVHLSVMVRIGFVFFF